MQDVGNARFSCLGLMLPHSTSIKLDACKKLVRIHYFDHPSILNRLQVDIPLEQKKKYFQYFWLITYLLMVDYENLKKLYFNC
jgi:hypothetical protein